MVMLSADILRTDGSGQVDILIGSQVPEKLPAVPDFANELQVKVGDHDFVFVFAAFDWDLPDVVAEGLNRISAPLRASRRAHSGKCRS